GQDRGHDPNRADGHGVVRQGRAGGSRETRRAAEELRSGGCGELPEGRVLERRATRHSRMGESAGPARRPDGRFPPERLHGMRDGGAPPAEHGRRIELRLICHATHTSCASGRTPSKNTSANTGEYGQSCWPSSKQSASPTTRSSGAAWSLS